MSPTLLFLHALYAQAINASQALFLKHNQLQRLLSAPEFRVTTESLALLTFSYGSLAKRARLVDSNHSIPASEVGSMNKFLYFPILDRSSLPSRHHSCLLLRMSHSEA